jgi:Lrp/AsnC family leucine-responsive transcriptional regulator
MDDLDRKALGILQKNGRATWAEVASELELSPPSAADRVRRLEEHGVIQRYTAVVDAEKLGYELTAFVAVGLTKPAHRASFLKVVMAAPEVLECHHIAGDADYLLKVRCRNTRHLDTLLTDVLKGGPAVARTSTTIVLATAKETTAVPTGL